MLGRFWRVKGPGLIIIIPVIQQVVRVDLRTIVMDVPSQDVISRDNVSVQSMLWCIFVLSFLKTQSSRLKIILRQPANWRKPHCGQYWGSMIWMICWLNASN